MDAVDRFAAETTAFQQWALHGTDSGAEAAREALIRITRLYLAGLELPSAWSEELADQPDAERVGNTEWGDVFATAQRRLPMKHYCEVFEPWAVRPMEPVVESLPDDIADIYRDVVTGLRAYQSGQRSVAVWEWEFGLHTHWGEHATGAIRALHCWLAKNASDKLASKP